MEIQLEEWKGWRIAGSDLDWQMQVLAKDSRSLTGYRWSGIRFYSSLDAALADAYERTLRESKEHARSMKSAVGECRRVKEELSKAVEDAGRE